MTAYQLCGLGMAWRRLCHLNTSSSSSLLRCLFLECGLALKGMSGSCCMVCIWRLKRTVAVARPIEQWLLICNYVRTLKVPTAKPSVPSALYLTNFLHSSHESLYLSICPWPVWGDLSVGESWVAVVPLLVFTTSGIPNLESIFSSRGTTACAVSDWRTSTTGYRE